MEALECFYSEENLCSVKNCKNPVVNIIHNICLKHSKDLKKFPRCDGKKCGTGKRIANVMLCDHNNLYVSRQDLMREWDYSRNSKSPKEYTLGPDTKVWWNCSNNVCGCHRWEASIGNRSRLNVGCPYCCEPALKVCPHNSFAAKFPEIAKEWHPILNGNKKPTDYLRGSGVKVWWLCSKPGVCECHVWEATILTRVGTGDKRGSECPMCSINRDAACPHKNFAKSFPEIAKEWHPTLNGNKKPENFLPHSHENVWWECSISECDCHVWKTTINCRTGNGTGCPYCVRKKLCAHNNLEAEFPKIADEWHPIKNVGIKPTQFSRGSNTIVWWICKKSSDFVHEWSAPITQRIDHCNNVIKGCPFCRSSTGEKCVREVLMRKEFVYVEQFIIFELPLKLYDFYIIYETRYKHYDILLEFDGIQHFEYIQFFHRHKDNFEQRRQVDILKTKTAIDNGYLFIRISYNDIEYIQYHIERALISFCYTDNKIYLSDIGLYDWLLEGIN